MATITTVSTLREAAEISDQAIDAAVDAVPTERAAPAYPLATGRTRDLVEMLRTNERAAETRMTDKAAWTRDMVRTTVLPANPVKG